MDCCCGCGCNNSQCNISTLTNSFLNCTISIVIEKNCGFNFITYLNEYATLIDIYKYVEQYYSHLDENKLLYLDKERKILITRNDIKIKHCFSDNNLLSITPLPERTVYKIYLTLI